MLKDIPTTPISQRNLSKVQFFKAALFFFLYPINVFNISHYFTNKFIISPVNPLFIIPRTTFTFLNHINIPYCLLNGIFSCFLHAPMNKPYFFHEHTSILVFSNSYQQPTYLSLSTFKILLFS